MKKGNYIYYAAALFVVLIWSTTFVSTKILLNRLGPVEIMFLRYVIAYITLLIAHPRFHRIKSVHEELLFLCAGVLGGTAYFLAENNALKLSLASNVSLLVATAPILTAVAAHFLLKGEKLNGSFGIGFVFAFIGSFFVIFNGHFVLKLNPMGDFLAVCAALSWALYSVLIKRIGDRYPSIYITRKVFFYSALTTIPILFLSGEKFELSALWRPDVLWNLLFLGILASSVCYLLWSKIIWKLGVIKTNSFIYFIPLLTMVCSNLVLSEPITPFAVAGGVLIVGGVYISDNGEKILNRLRKR
jgi:drug/metabolite transporter (DMT)-like permease